MSFPLPNITPLALVNKHIFSVAAEVNGMFFSRIVVSTAMANSFRLHLHLHYHLGPITVCIKIIKTPNGPPYRW
jgi:hypothetical protein